MYSFKFCESIVSSNMYVYSVRPCLDVLYKFCIVSGQLENSFWVVFILLILLKYIYIYIIERAGKSYKFKAKKAGKTPIFT